MSRQSWHVLIAALTLMVFAGGMIGYLQEHQTLGMPGVKLTNDIMRTESGSILGTEVVYLPSQVLNYNSETLPIPELVSNWLPKDTTYGHRRYTARDGFLVDNNVVLMKGDRSSIHQPRYCLTGQGWHIESEELASIPVRQPFPYTLEVMKVMASRQIKVDDGRTQPIRGIYVYWFVADHELTPNHKKALGWLLARDLLKKGVLKRWAYVSCFSICPVGGEEAAFERMKQFITASVPEFQLATGPSKDR